MPRYLLDTNMCIYPVSYTHLDVYKRQVLDRPNPIGGVRVEGPVLQPEYASFIGEFPIPVRHGMTLGELARLFNQEFGIGAELHVVPVKGWQRSAAEPGHALPWVPPSPNMPTPDTALVYPCLLYTSRCV